MVVTHRLEKSGERYRCYACEQEAHYWSQDEQKGGLARGAVVYHCQAHRDIARAAAAHVNARVNRRASAAKIRAENPDLRPVYKTPRQGWLARLGL
jgi:hypothetical protein